MPKKSAAPRTATQRKLKQKSFELVRPDVHTEGTDEQEEDEMLEATPVEAAPTPVTVATAQSEATARAAASPKVKEFKTAQKTVDTPPQDEAVAEASSTQADRESAAARPASRRQSAHKVQRTATAMISAEHYGYVRKDLIFIAILAFIMFSAIIILHFVPGIGY